MSQDNNDNRSNDKSCPEGPTGKDAKDKKTRDKGITDKFWFQFLVMPLGSVLAFALLVSLLELAGVGRFLVKVPLVGPTFRSICHSVNASCENYAYLIYDPAVDVSRKRDPLDFKERLKKELDEYEDILRKDNSDPIAWTNFGEVTRQLGDPKGAVKAQQKALEISGDSEPALLGLALAQANLHQFEEANVAVAKAIRQNPDRALNYVCQAEILYLQQNRQKAVEEALKRAYQLDHMYGLIPKNVCGTRRW